MDAVLKLRNELTVLPLSTKNGHLYLLIQEIEVSLVKPTGISEDTEGGHHGTERIVGPSSDCHTKSTGVFLQ